MQFFDVVFTIIAWTIIVAVLWIAMLYFLVFGDSRPKEGVRCRKCFYNLFGISSDTCPECGAVLEREGVWKNGQPRRSFIIHMMAVSAWCLYVPIALLIQWPFANLEKLGISYRVYDLIIISILVSAWIIPVCLGVFLRFRRNKQAIGRWPIDREETP